MGSGPSGAFVIGGSRANSQRTPIKLMSLSPMDYQLRQKWDEHMSMVQNRKDDVNL